MFLLVPGHWCRTGAEQRIRRKRAVTSGKKARISSCSCAAASTQVHTPLSTAFLVVSHSKRMWAEQSVISTRDTPKQTYKIQIKTIERSISCSFTNRWLPTPDFSLHVHSSARACRRRSLLCLSWRSFISPIAFPADPTTPGDGERPL